MAGAIDILQVEIEAVRAETARHETATMAQQARRRFDSQWQDITLAFLLGCHDGPRPCLERSWHYWGRALCAGAAGVSDLWSGPAMSTARDIHERYRAINASKATRATP